MINLGVLGRICLEILLRKNWSPAIHIKIVLASIIHLLCNPDKEGTYNNEAAQHWRNNKKDA
jgi:ubiquitin-protein ligase